MSRTGMRGKHGKHTKHCKFSITKTGDLFSKRSLLQSCQTTQSSVVPVRKCKEVYFWNFSSLSRWLNKSSFLFKRSYDHILCFWDSSATTSTLRTQALLEKVCYVSTDLRFLKILMWSDNFKCHIYIAK